MSDRIRLSRLTRVENDVSYCCQAPAHTYMKAPSLPLSSSSLLWLLLVLLWLVVVDAFLFGPQLLTTSQHRRSSSSLERARGGWAHTKNNNNNSLEEEEDEEETRVLDDTEGGGGGGTLEETDWKRRDFMYNVVGAGLLAASGVSATYLFQSSVYTHRKERMPRCGVSGPWIQDPEGSG